MNQPLDGGAGTLYFARRSFGSDSELWGWTPEVQPFIYLLADVSYGDFGSLPLFLTEF